MTKHKAGESKAERRLRRVREHNKKMITEHFRLDYDKHTKERMKCLGEYYRSITAKFSDKEIEEAIQIGLFIIDRVKPEDGLSYEEIAEVLWGDPRKGLSSEAIPEEYLKDDMYVSKIDHLLYVLQMINFDFGFNMTMEPEEASKRTIPIMPYVRPTKRLRDKDDDGNYFYKEYGKPIRIIFNAAANREYASEAIEKLDGIHKLKSNDYARVNVPHPLSKEERQCEIILNDLKGVGNRHIGQYVEELSTLVKRIDLVTLDPMEVKAI